MAKIGPKEAATRALRESHCDIPTKLRRGHPDCAYNSPAPKPVKAAAPPISGTVQPKAPAPPTADQQEDDVRKTSTKAKAKSKKTAKAKARTPVAKTDGGVRPGSKLETVVKLLKRTEGCTTADVLKATGWPSVSMPQQAKAAGLTLKKEKDGTVTRYRAA